MNKIQQQIEQNEREFEEIRCKSGSVGLQTNDQSSNATYNIHKCGFCGRKWHIYEQAPICQEHRSKYPNEKSFLHSSQLSIIKAELLDLPEERIVHEYMEIQGDGKSKEYCNGWNDYRNAMITRLNELLK